MPLHEIAIITLWALGALGFGKILTVVMHRAIRKHPAADLVLREPATLVFLALICLTWPTSLIVLIVTGRRLNRRDSN